MSGQNTTHGPPFLQSLTSFAHNPKQNARKRAKAATSFAISTRTAATSVPTPRFAYEKTVDRAQLVRLCKERTGMEPREFQLRAAEAALTRHDIDCVLNIPTGGGKTLCFYLPTLIRPGNTVLVVSPLTALMKDQVGWSFSNRGSLSYLRLSIGPHD